MKEIRNLISAIIREKIFKADVPYIVEQRNYLKPPQKRAIINLLNKNYPYLKISFLEVGSRGGLPSYSPWVPLLGLNNLYIEGIEPDKEEAKALMEKKGSPYKRIYTDVIYKRKAKVTLFITKGLGSTSIYEPNIKDLKYYTNHEKFFIQRKTTIEAKPLDSVIPKDTKFDFVNIDVQGAEYDVIKGGKRVFRDIIGGSLESHLFEYYKGEKLFPEIHNLLKKDFSPLRLNLRLIGGEVGEIGDTVYIRKHNLIKTKEELLKRILFCVLFDRKEHIELLLRHYSNRLSKEEQDRIKRILDINLKKSHKIETTLSLEDWNSYSASKKHYDGSGY